jgi:hypothetical protein
MPPRPRPPAPPPNACAQPPAPPGQRSRAQLRVLAPMLSLPHCPSPRPLPAASHPHPDSPALIIAARGQHAGHLRPGRAVRPVDLGRAFNVLAAWPPRRGPVPNISLAKVPACTARMKTIQLRGVTTSAGPAGCAESRTATIPGRLAATSTQFWPSDELRALLRHTAPQRSIGPALGAMLHLLQVIRHADHAIRRATSAIMARDSLGPAARATRWLNLRVYRSMSGGSSR